MRTLRHAAAAASVLGLLFATGCNTPKAEATSTGVGGSTTASTASTETRNLAPVELTNEITATSDVTAVDKAKRLVTLRREDGTMFQVLCGSEVRNFDQIAAGDKLKVRFKENLKASLRPANDSGPQAGAGVVAARAPVGGTPAAAAGVGVSVKVKIESIDREHGIVVFSLPSGELVSHRIATPQGKTFVEGLKIGDKVQLEYSQAMALAVEKV
jgi:hypothetical protein